MGLTAAIIGGISGTSIHMMTNAVRKVPLSRSKSVLHHDASLPNT
jgi:hypothetical protein